jgi:acetyltransferase-like isoleucine patch superfamily enzyme
MQVKVLVPREDVNDDSAVFVRYLVTQGESVQKDQPIALFETSKTVFEVVAPVAGTLVALLEPGAELSVGTAFAAIESDYSPGPSPELPVPAVAIPVAAPAKVSQRLTRSATLSGLPADPALRGWVSLRDLRQETSTKWRQRVVLIGAGSVGLQALDILLHDPAVEVAGLLDDHPLASQRNLFGYPLLGKFADLLSLYSDGIFDQALITVGLNLPRRLQLYELCRTHDIPLANAIDPTVRRNRGVILGQGNILCSFVHLGVLAELGDNNFVAAHSSLDHHNRIGNHNLFGPGCLLSGGVTVGDRCTFGSGVVVQPNLSIGNDCLVASATALLKDLPDGRSHRLHLKGEP